MEASEILNMVEDSLYNHFFIIDFIVRDDDRTMRYVLKNPSKGAQGQVMKSPKGKNYEETPEPSFLVDPFCLVKAVAKHIFSIVDKSRDQQCGFTKSHALRLNKYWGNMINNHREETI